MRLLADLEIWVFWPERGHSVSLFRELFTFLSDLKNEEEDLFRRTPRQEDLRRRGLMKRRPDL